MFTLMFWRATVERAVSTAAQASILAVGTDVVEALQVDAFHLDFARLASYAAGGALLAVLKALAAAKVSGSGPGFGSAEVLTPQPARRVLGIMRHDRFDIFEDGHGDEDYVDPPEPRP